jgi:ABC-type nitrate/sulfonate/bicarbonate transport system substrate-binding protein
VFAQKLGVSDVISTEKMKFTWGYCPFGMMETPVMKEKKFYKKYLPNVDVDWFFGLYSVHLINNWIAGKMEVAYMGDMPAAMLESKEGKTRWVNTAVYPHGQIAAMFVPKNSKIKTIRELHGKTVATGVGSSHHAMLISVEEREGIKFNIVNQPPEVSIGNLEAGKIDALEAWPPYIDLLKYRKIGKCLSPCNFKAWEPEVKKIWGLFVSDNFARKHPDIVRGLVKADNDLHKFMVEHPDEAAQIVFKDLEGKIPLQVVKESLARYTYSDELNSEHIAIMQKSIDFLYKNKFIRKKVDASKWADTSFR